MKDQDQRPQACPGRDSGHIFTPPWNPLQKQPGEEGCQVSAWLGLMGRDGWEVGSSKLGMTRKGEETVCGEDPGIKVTWVVFVCWDPWK